ncbi:hypothetical protein C9374_005862 [Naegleria lovaniensis]|uniref:Uncharacterized protein n=1 Tax=Naegleria lovaniensis TaxID=51637 RepID=A0AA88KJZ0_NAELO|nr:uncharacterized protein C9374_005862 [Naegleria lovaniensis]KAG2382070.1 hypothetical protein C9374_005862 [Naegleria lovaniensis]
MEVYLERSSDQAARTQQPLKRALIVYSSSDPEIFMKIVYEKFSSFVATTQNSERQAKSDIAYSYTPEKLCFLSGLDRVEYHQFATSYVDLIGRHDLLIFTLYSGGDWQAHNSSSGLEQYLLNEIESRRVSVLFLRGSHGSAPSKLGFVKASVKSGYVDFVQGTTAINLQEMNELSLKSSNIAAFMNENAQYFKKEANTTCCDLEDCYLCGIMETSLVDLKKWHVLMKSAHHPKQLSLLVHKDYKVMFTPWYGCSHKNQVSHDIVLYFCRYLLYDAFQSSESTMKTRLLNQLLNLPQFWDINVRTHVGFE